MAAAMADSGNPQKDLIKIRDLILADQTALDRWQRIVDLIVYPAEDILTVKGLLENRNYGVAVLKSLQIWESVGGSVKDLISVLRMHGLNKLAGQIELTIAGDGDQAPSISGVWFEVGEVVHNFTGREHELEKLHMMLSYEHSNESVESNIVGVCGPSGIGKTVLARKYAFKYADYYDGNVLWVDGRSAESIRASFTRLAARVGITGGAGVAAKVYEKFAHEKSLLVVDNLKSLAHFDQFKPKIKDRRNCTPYILITSDSEDVTFIPGNRLRLIGLTEEETKLFCWRYLPECSAENADRLAEEIGGHPLALTMALSSLSLSHPRSQNGYNIPRFLDKIDKARSALRRLWSLSMDDSELTELENQQILLAVVAHVSCEEVIGRSPEVNNGIKVLMLLTLTGPVPPDDAFDCSEPEPSSDDYLYLLENLSLIRSPHHPTIKIINSFIHTHSALRTAISNSCTKEIVTSVIVMLVEARLAGNLAAPCGTSTREALSAIQKWLRGVHPEWRHVEQIRNTAASVMKNSERGKLAEVKKGLKLLRGQILVDEANSTDSASRVGRCIELMETNDVSRMCSNLELQDSRGRMEWRRIVRSRLRKCVLL